MPKTTWMEVPHVSTDLLVSWREGILKSACPVLVIRGWRHKMTLTMLVPREGTEFPGSRREQRDSLINLDTTESCSGVAASQRLKRWKGNRTSTPRRKPVGREPVQWDHRACGGGSFARQARTLMKAASEHRIGTRVPARRKDIVLAGGICCVLDEQVRHRQRQKDAAAEASWPKGRHTHSGIRREDFVHAGQASEREKVGTAVPSRSVCGDAELVIRGSCRHRARNDQDTLGKHQENA